MTAIMPDGFTLFVALAGVFLIAFMKGAFGGGFAIIGIPILSLAMDPVAAGVLLAPLFVVMDLTALRYWRPATWSKQDVTILVPALVVGVLMGYFVLRDLDEHAIEILIATVTLTFAAVWSLGGGVVRAHPRSTAKAVAAGLGSGVTTMVAHSGGPALALYLLPLGLPKEMYAGTTSIVFTIGNFIKAGPWLLLSPPSFPQAMLMMLCLPSVPLGVWAGWKFHHRVNQHTLYRACYGLLVVTATKLLWDGLSGL